MCSPSLISRLWFCISLADASFLPCTLSPPSRNHHIHHYSYKSLLRSAIPCFLPLQSRIVSLFQQPSPISHVSGFQLDVLASLFDAVAFSAKTTTFTHYSDDKWSNLNVHTNARSHSAAPPLISRIILAGARLSTTTEAQAAGCPG